MKTQITKKLFKIILLAGVLIIFSLNQAKATIALCINESGQSPLAPELINDADAQVDDTIKIAFVDESNWRLAIYAIQIKDIALPDSVFHILPNEIQIYPFKYKGLQIAGVYNFTVMALGFPNVEISQKVKHGKTSTLDISAVPYTPNMEDGTLSNQPVIKLYDKFENLCVDDNYTVVTIIPSSSNWTLTGQLTKSAVNGKVTFTGLKALVIISNL